MPHPVFAPGRTALITGGAGGIGLAVAKLAHGHGMNVALVDINAEALSSAKAAVKAAKGDGNGGDSGAAAAVDAPTGHPPAVVEAYAVDVSRVEQWHDLKVKVDEKFGEVHFLMLNAGVGGKGSWEDGGYFRRIMDTNLFGPINGITTFLPTVQAAASSLPESSSTSTTSTTAIVLTGSKQGITNPPGNPAYNASKAAIKTLAEHLAYDLRDTRTSVHLLVPGYTFTGMTGGGGPQKGPLAEMREKPAAAWEPAQVADFLLTKMNEGQFYIICPDNEVTEDTDRRRMLWSAGDAVYGRPPLTRWREDWKERARGEMEGMTL